MGNGVTADTPGNGREIRWRLGRVEERLREIEEADPKLMRFEMQQMNRKLDLLLKVLVTVGISTVTGAILLALNLAQGA